MSADKDRSIRRVKQKRAKERKKLAKAERRLAAGAPRDTAPGAASA